MWSTVATSCAIGRAMRIRNQTALLDPVPARKIPLLPRVMHKVLPVGSEQNHPTPQSPIAKQKNSKPGGTQEEELAQKPSFGYDVGHAFNVVSVKEILQAI